MKRSVPHLLAVPLALLAFGGTWAAEARAATPDDTTQVVRPGIPGERPFWNINAHRFIYAPAFDLPEVEGAASYRFAIKAAGGRELMFEVRGLLTGPEGGLPVKAGNTVGNLFLGSDGWMWVDGDGFQVYKGEKSELAAQEKGADSAGAILHMENFLSAVRSRNYKDLNADIEIGATSATLCHLANIAYRVGRKLDWDPARKRFVNAPDADKLLTRDYRKPYVV